MRVIVLNDEDSGVRNLFKDFVPKEFESLMEEGKSFMIGAVEADPEGLRLLVPGDHGGALSGRPADG